MIIRNTLTALLLLGTAMPSLAAQQPRVDCKDLAQANAVNATFDADEAAKQNAVNQHTADRLYKIDAEAKALIKAGAWTEDDRKSYFGKQRSTAAYSKLEQSKKELLFSVQIGRSTAPGIRATNPPGACSYALSTLSSYDDLQAITDTQYDMLEAGMSAIAHDKSVTLPQ
jgi:hypothetical protein